MFVRQEQIRKSKGEPWKNVGEKYLVHENPFTYGKIRMDRPRAKQDGDSYRVYSETLSNGIDSRPKTVIITNKYTPNRRTVFTRINKK